MREAPSTRERFPASLPEYNGPSAAKEPSPTKAYSGEREETPVDGRNPERKECVSPGIVIEEPPGDQPRDHLRTRTRVRTSHANRGTTKDYGVVPRGPLALSWLVAVKHRNTRAVLSLQGVTCISYIWACKTNNSGRGRRVFGLARPYRVDLQRAVAAIKLTPATIVMAFRGNPSTVQKKAKTRPYGQH